VEHRLGEFENRALRKVFGLRKVDVRGGCRKLRNGELYNLYCLPSIIRMIKTRRVRWASYKARIGQKMNGYRILVGKLEGKGPPRKPTLR
jgi:hypothetical protein